MNERIKELKSQCWDERPYGPPWFNSDKFAKLILRECIWALWTEECRTSDLASEEYTRGSNKIKEHFGVKE